MKTNWRDLNKQLPLLSEQEVLDLLNAERAGARRSTVLERLHQRYCSLRMTRERQEILNEAKTL